MLKAVSRRVEDAGNGDEEVDSELSKRACTCEGESCSADGVALVSANDSNVSSVAFIDWAVAVEGLMGGDDVELEWGTTSAGGAARAGGLATGEPATGRGDG